MSFIFLMFFSLNSFSWGGGAHQVSAVISSRHLNSQALTEIRKFANPAKLNQYAITPDRLLHWDQARWGHTSTLHYINLNDNETYFEAIQNYSIRRVQDGDAFMGILKASFMLLDNSISQKDKQNALAFLIHLIQDIHQPLHLGRFSDRGGNFIQKIWFGENRNLHWIWDSGIFLGIIGVNSSTHQQSSKDVDVYLANMGQLRSADLSAWTKGSVFNWMMESFELRDLAYRSSSAGELMLINVHSSLVNQRIAQAGVRTAHYLNQLFSQGSLDTHTLRIFKRMQKILGDSFLDHIQLRPMAQKSFNGLIFEPDFENQDLPFCLDHVH
jgi:hypothetical protein